MTKFTSTTLLAAATAIGIGFGATSAFAGDGDVPQANTFFSELPGVIATAPVGSPMGATASVQLQHSPSIGTYVTNSRDGTWLFQGGGSHEGANS
jgi:hypothetical protein